MKAFTDIEQSKKLAEILPLESADMHYVRKTHDFMGNPVDGEWSHPKYGKPNSKFADYIVQNFAHYEKLFCWSLAAMLEQLEDTAGLAKDYGLWFCYDNRKSYCTKHYDNPIDACYEMIVTLKEKGLI